MQCKCNKVGFAAFVVRLPQESSSSTSSSSSSSSGDDGPSGHGGGGGGGGNTMGRHTNDRAVAVQSVLPYVTEQLNRFLPGHHVASTWNMDMIVDLGFPVGIDSNLIRFGLYKNHSQMKQPLDLGNNYSLSFIIRHVYNLTWISSSLSSSIKSNVIVKVKVSQIVFCCFCC